MICFVDFSTKYSSILDTFITKATIMIVIMIIKTIITKTYGLCPLMAHYIFYVASFHFLSHSVSLFAI